MGDGWKMVGLVSMAAGFVPLARAWRANARTTLRPALGWALAAWAIWSVLAYPGGPGAALSGVLRWLALSMTACAGIAVLGARRPGVAAWNFVVGSLLLILLMPVATGLGRLQLWDYDFLFLVGALAVGLLNYLPTRVAPAALAVAFACREQLGAHSKLGTLSDSPATVFLSLGLAPWLGWACLRVGRRPASEVDSLWRDFRDRFGWFWAERTREQFNRSAANAGWPVVLGWRGMRRSGSGTAPSAAELVAALRALLRRFSRRDQ